MNFLKSRTSEIELPYAPQKWSNLRRYLHLPSIRGSFT